ncbi:MAG: hypothetical protein P8I96_01535, partial [Opitutae bacterium]|nr:hypothetical protein [Opitutae bacterium]
PRALHLRSIVWFVGTWLRDGSPSPRLVRLKINFKSPDFGRGFFLPGSKADENTSSGGLTDYGERIMPCCSIRYDAC